MARKNTQETSREPTRSEVRRAVINAATYLDAESDLFHENLGITAQQWQCIGLLVAGSKQVDAAEAVNVTQETVSRWRASPLFASALNLAIRDSYQSTIGRVRDITKDAIEALRECLYSEDEKVRLSAALAVVRLRLQLDAGAMDAPTTPAGIAKKMKEEDYRDAITGMF